MIAQDPEITKLRKLQKQLAELPLVPLDSRLRKKRDRVQKELRDLAFKLNMVSEIDLLAGTF